MRLQGVWVAALVAAVLVAAACGGDSDGGGGGATTGDDGSTTLRIGVAYPDLEAFAQLNEKFGIGDPEAQADAVLERWRREGLLPVQGHDLEFVYRSYNVISDDDKFAACTGFAQDDDVFAVISGRQFTEGAECLATRFDIPVIDVNSAPLAMYQRGAPWFFTLRPDHTTMLTSFAEWADGTGVLDGARLGLFWERQLEDAVNAMKARLADLGHAVVSEVVADGEGIGSPQDQIAAPRLEADGVDTIMLLVGGTSVLNVTTAADRQGYEPTWLSVDYDEQTTDVAADAIVETQSEGTLAMTATRIGEAGAGRELSAATTTCVDAYERFSGAELTLDGPESGEYGNVLITCDLTSLLLEGLGGAQLPLTQESFVAALEEIEAMEMASVSDVTFSADDHAGADGFRTIQWHSSCPCWIPVDDFASYGS